MSEAPVLLPCPFCQGTDLSIRKDYAEDDPSHSYAMHVFCNDCHAHGRNNYPIGWCESETAAAEAWNDREPSGLSHAGFVSEHIARELKRGISGAITVGHIKTPIRFVEIYVRNRRSYSTY